MPEETMIIDEQENVLVQQRIDTYKLADAERRKALTALKAEISNENLKALEDAQERFQTAARNLSKRVIDLFESGYRLRL